MSEVKIEVLEERVKHLEEMVLKHTEDDARQLAEINAKLDSMLLLVAKYKGVLGGLLLAASAVGAFISYALHYLGRG